MSRLLTMMIVAVAASSALLASDRDEGGAPIPGLLSDFDAKNRSTPEVRKLLDSTPRKGSDATYAGLLNHAARAANELASASREWPMDRPKALTVAIRESTKPGEAKGSTGEVRAIRPHEAALRLDLALERYIDSVGELAPAIESASGDPARWLLAARATLALAKSRPTREALAPLTGETGRRIDRARVGVDDAMSRLIASGYTLRASALGALPGESRESKIRNAARSVASLGLNAWEGAVASFDKRLADDPLMRLYNEWMSAEANDAHPLEPGWIEPFGGADAPRFAVGDVPRLVPWPYSLAQALDLGTIRLGWEVAGFESPDAATIQPRINVSARFVLKGNNGRSAGSLPIYVIKLKGPSADARTFGDEAGYRKDLASFAEGRFPAPAKALIADTAGNPTVAALLAKLADPKLAGGAIDLVEFHNARRRSLGDRLAHNPMAHALYERTWGRGGRPSGSVIDRDLTWIARSPQLRLAPPIQSAPAAVATAAAPPPAPEVAWFVLRGVESRVVEPFELDVAAISGPLRDAFERSLERVEAGTIGELNNDPRVIALSEAEGRSRGTTGRSIGAGIRERRDQIADRLRASAPNWLAPELLYDLPDARPIRESDEIGRSRLVADLGTSWRDAERLADEAIERSPSAPSAWPEFVGTLAELEALGLSLYGPDFGRDPNPPADSPEASPLLVGRVRPSSRATNERSETNALAKLETEAARIADEATSVRVAILEIAWIDRVTSLATPGNASWAPYVEEHAIDRPPPTPPADPKAKATPAVPPAVAAPPDAKFTTHLQARRARLVAGSQSRLEGLAKAAVKGQDEALILQTNAIATHRDTHPEIAYDPESMPVAGDAVVASFAMLASQLKAAIEDVKLIASPTSPLPPDRLQAYEDWPSLSRGQGPSGRQRQAILDRIGRTEAINTWARACKSEIEAALPADSRAKPREHHNDPKILNARAVDGALAEILDRTWTLETAGLPSRFATRAATAEYVAEGPAIDPADLIVQALHIGAAKAGWTLDVKQARPGRDGRSFRLRSD